jgi:hypothetical protein
MPATFSKTAQQSARPIEHDQLPEFGDSKDLKNVFGLRETFSYILWKRGDIRSVLVPGRRGQRGKRLFDFESVRAFLRSCETNEQAELLACGGAKRRKKTPIGRQP